MSNYCNDVNVLNVMRVINNIIELIKYIIPIVLIVLIMVRIVKTIMDGDGEAISKAIRNSFKMFIAAVLIFLVPTIVYAIFNSINADNSVINCFKNGNKEKIAELYSINSRELIDKLYISLNEDDYYIALKYVNTIQDKTIRKEYMDELAAIKDKIDYNTIYNNINKLSKNYSLNEYNNVLKSIEDVTNVEYKEKLLAKIKTVEPLVLLKRDIELLYSSDNITYDDLVTRINNINDENTKKEFSKLLKEKVESSPRLNVTPGDYIKKYNSLEYYEIIPPHPQRNMPLIVFLHGGAELGYMDRLKATDISSFVKSGNAYAYGEFFYLAPLIKSGEWPNEKNLMPLIEKVVKEYEINPKKIVITGMSLGAIGVYYYVGGYNNYFSAAVPMSFKFMGATANDFKTTPVYAIVGSEEGSTVTDMKYFVDSVNQIGGSAKIDIKSGKNHNNIKEAYRDKELFKWMLSQTRK